MGATMAAHTHCLRPCRSLCLRLAYATPYVHYGKREAEAKPYHGGYYGGYYGYARPYYGGYAYYGKRSADAEAKPVCTGLHTPIACGLAAPYAYGLAYATPYVHYGKREAEAKPYH